MRAMTLVLASWLVLVAEAGLAQDYIFYGRPYPVYYAQPQPVVIFGRPPPISPYAPTVVYFGLAPMSNYSYPVAFPYVAGYRPGYWPRPIYYSPPPAPPAMQGAPLRVNPAGT
jgi:hypothetical protein